MNQELSDLREKADSLGIEYPKNVGFAKLEEKIAEANEKSLAKRNGKKDVSKSGLPKGVKLTDAQIRIAQAKQPRKIKVANLNADNKGATTVTVGILNDFMSVQKAVPLNKDVVLEECLVQQIEARSFSVGVPELDKNGDNTGNFVVVEQAEYAVIRY